MMTTPNQVPRQDDIQGIVLHGYGHLHEARFILLGVRPGYASQARRHLASLQLTSAATAALRAKAPGPFVNVALTHAGLEALGLDKKLLTDFPRDFVEGPTTEARARLLGDQGESRPATWLWGSPTTRPVHAMLMLYASQGIDALCDGYASRAAAAGLDTIRSLDTIRLPRRQEHFGFRDGIAQPTVLGLGTPDPPNNVAETGEIFLGCANAFGERAHVPGDGHTTFALNGTYLGARQLEQDVPGFWASCRAATSSDEEAIRLASRMVGRWPNGTPLVLDPDRDSMAANVTDTDRDLFDYAEADPDGLKCPFGAHVRRSNPRDWGVAGSAEECRKVVSRHRIIRRGRAYGAPFRADAEPSSYLEALGAADPAPGRGLHFLCFNANIEQQFEFVQRQWCGNPKFAGAVNGADPLIGDHRPLAGDPPTFSIQRETAPQHVAMTRRFVHTRGAAYLFMPAIGAVASLANVP
jgi:Dyp-type peroxidase family